MEVQYGGGAREEHKVNISSIYSGRRLLWEIFKFKIDGSARVVINVEEDEKIEEVRNSEGKLEKLVIEKKVMGS